MVLKKPVVLHNLVRDNKNSINNRVFLLTLIEIIDEKDEKRYREIFTRFMMYVGKYVF